MNSPRPLPPDFVTILVLLVCMSLTVGCRQTPPSDPAARQSTESRRTDSGGAEKSSGPDREVVVLKSTEMLVAMASGTDPAAVARAHDLTWIRTLKSDPDMHLLAAASFENARAAKDALARDARVRRVYLNPPSQNQPFTR